MRSLALSDLVKRRASNERRGVMKVRRGAHEQRKKNREGKSWSQRDKAGRSESAGLDPGQHNTQAKRQVKTRCGGQSGIWPSGLRRLLLY